MVCPQYGCGRELKYAMLTNILSSEQLDKYSQFKDELKLMLDPKRAYCPNSKCSKVTEVGDKRKQKKVTCMHCEFEFCAKCQSEWILHKGKKCKELLA